MLEKEKIFKLIIPVILFFILFGFMMYKKQNIEYDNLINNNILIEDTVENSDNIKIFESSVDSTLKIKVHITGEIQSPGLYEIDEKSRINDLVFIAGGPTEKADLGKVNLAYELNDGEKIYIPSIFDETDTYISNDAGENVLEASSLSTLTKNRKININKATQEDLQTISGIGPSLAQKIILYRETNGKFTSIEDLKNVSGVGEKKFESIKDYITLN